MTLQPRTKSRQPSEELLNLIKEVSNVGTKLSELFEAIKKKGHEEGFTDYEIKDMLRTHLKRSLTAGQINWYLFGKEKYNLKKRLAAASQIERKKVIEQEDKDIELRSRTKVQNVAMPNSVPIAVKEITKVESDQEKELQETESLQDLRAIIETQAQYINMLEDKIQEKQEVQRAQSQLRIRASVSQLYKDILMRRNSGGVYVNILIDGNKYQTLEMI
jgi:hypothetical protein